MIICQVYIYRIDLKILPKVKQSLHGTHEDHLAYKMYLRLTRIFRSHAHNICHPNNKLTILNSNQGLGPLQINSIK